MKQSVTTLIFLRVGFRKNMKGHTKKKKTTTTTIVTLDSEPKIKE